MRIIINNKKKYMIGVQERMTLFEAQKGEEYIVDGLFVEEAVTRRLQALGLNDGTPVKVLNRKKREH